MLEIDYLLIEKSERQTHLNLEEPCIERGGKSTHHKGVLAQFLNTPIFGRPIDLCHACHNGDCSNPKHLYWGSRRENIQDNMDNGNAKSGWYTLVEKHGENKAREMMREYGRRRKN